MDLNKLFPDWEKKDARCMICNSVTKRQKGMTKQNMKNLFSLKFTFNDFLITFMIVMILVMAYFYSIETKAARDWVKKLEDDPTKYCTILTTNVSYGTNLEFNLSELTIEDGKTET